MEKFFLSRKASGQFILSDAQKLPQLWTPTKIYPLLQAIRNMFRRGHGLRGEGWHATFERARIGDSEAKVIFVSRPRRDPQGAVQSSRGLVQQVGRSQWMKHIEFSTCNISVQRITYHIIAYHYNSTSRAESPAQGFFVHHSLLLTTVDQKSWAFHLNRTLFRFITVSLLPTLAPAFEVPT